MADGSIAELFAELGLKIDFAAFNKASQLISNLGTAIAGLAIYEGIKKIGQFVEATVEAGVQAEHTGEKLGITAQAVQELGYAADVSGASAEQMQVGMQRLALGMEQAKKKGTGPLAEGLQKLGIHMSDPAIQGGKLDEIISRVADGFADAGPHVNKTGVAMEIFGRSGTALLPMLNKGADGIAELRQEFVDLGAELDENAIQKLKTFEEDQKKLKYTMIGFRNTAVMALLPTLQELATGLQKWIAAHRKLIEMRIKELIEGLAVAFRVVARVAGIFMGVLHLVAGAFEKLAEWLEKVTGYSTDLEDVLVAAGVAVGLAWMEASAPLLLWLALIAAIILVVQDLWVWMNGGDSVLKRLYNSFVTYLGETGVGKVILGIIHAFKAVIDAIKDAITWLAEIGSKAGTAVAWYKQKNRNLAEMKANNSINPDTGLHYTEQEMQDKAEADATKDVLQSEQDSTDNIKNQAYVDSIVAKQKQYGSNGQGVGPTYDQIKQFEAANQYLASVADRSAEAQRMGADYSAPAVPTEIAQFGKTAPVTVGDVHVEIHGADLSNPKATSDAVNDGLARFFDAQLHAAAHSTGGTQGKLP